MFRHDGQCLKMTLETSRLPGKRPFKAACDRKQIVLSGPRNGLCDAASGGRSAKAQETADQPYATLNRDEPMAYEDLNLNKQRADPPMTNLHCHSPCAYFRI